MAGDELTIFTPLGSGEKLEPEECWVIWNESHTAYAFGNSPDEKGAMYIFITDELAQQFIVRMSLAGATAQNYTWEQLVEEFGHERDKVLINPTCEPGFREIIPLVISPRVSPFE